MSSRFDQGMERNSSETIAKNRILWRRGTEWDPRYYSELWERKWICDGK
jgi:hypothetical protein